MLRAIPQVYPAMPDGAATALPLLECALELEPDYALAHGFAASCHEVLFVRGGRRDENRLGAARHARAAIAHGRDDAIALLLGGFVPGLVVHDRDAARQAFEAARKVLQSNPYWSFAHMLLAATHAKLGRLDAAKAAAARVLELEPSYTISGMCTALDMQVSLAAPFSEALGAVGLPA